MKKQNQNLAICNNPPNDLGMEQSVLGYLIAGNDFGKVSFLMEDMFYSEDNRLVFKEIMSMLRDGESMDIVILKDRLKSANIPPVYLADLAHSFVSGVLSIRHAEIVREKYYSRRLLSECEKIESNIYSGYPVNIDNMIELSEESKIFTSAGLEEKHREYEDRLDNTFARIETMSKGRPEYPTGIYSLDEKTGGLGMGDLLTIGGCTAIGKTAFALTICKKLLKLGKKVGYFSLEMGEEQLYIRMAQMETGINLSMAKIYGMHKDILGEVKEAMIKLKKYDMMVWDMLDANTAIMKLIESTKRDVVIVDHIQLVLATKEENRYRELGRIARTFKVVAKRLGICVIILSQLKRGAESRDELYVSDCYESGGIEQNSDGVWLIDRPAVHRGKGELTDAILYIGKNRHGETGKVNLFFDTSLLEFRGVDF